ncbi:hypothetical protein HZC34_06255 [Candidatus Saganbacteria bacterium]|nr:hypothetical protein [Candidatus Saganbacteria bacterium]
MKITKRSKEYFIDNISRTNQVVFTVLIVGTFVTGFNIIVFIIGSIIFLLLLLAGTFLTSKTEDQ